MNAIIKTILIAFSRLPFTVMYGISDVLYFFQKYFIKYRKEVVLNNLRKAFPDKSSDEIKEIAEDHFRNFCDFTMETIKGLSVSQAELDERAVLINKDVMQRVFNEKGSIMVLCGHLFNWEWIKGLTKDFPTQDMYAVYHTPNSKLVDSLVKKSREQFGGETISMNNSKFLLSKIINDDGFLFLMVADQSPFRKAIRYDLQFLNQTTPVFQGFDKLARKGDMGVVYLKVNRVGRGHFTYDPIPITPKGKTFEENEIVHKFFELLEKNIKEDPANYMWTHKRWKYQKGKHY